MYELTLDNSSVFFWRLTLLCVLARLGISLVALGFVALRRRHRRLVFVATALLVLAVAGLVVTTLSPFSYYRRKIEPSIVVGEELYRRYSDYQTEHSRYPLTIGDVYFQGLDAFDVVANVRSDLTKCDGSREGCRVIDAGLSPDGLVVTVSDGMIRCGITNLERRWTCRDLR